MPTYLLALQSAIRYWSSLLITLKQWSMNASWSWWSPIFILTTTCFLLKWARQEVIIQCSVRGTPWMVDTHDFLINMLNDTDPAPKDEFAIEAQDGEYVDYTPNIVHFIRFSGANVSMSLVNYISIISAHKVQHPEAIYFHCDHLPTGQWWETLREEIPITVVEREAPSEIFGKTLTNMHHKVDVAKLQILLEYGGIYMENDVFLIKPLTIAEKYDVTIGWMRSKQLDTSIIMANKGSQFIKLWYDSYRTDYRGHAEYHNSNSVPSDLHKQNHGLVKALPLALSKPPGMINKRVWFHKVPRAAIWRHERAIHLGVQARNVHLTLQDIARRNSIFGQAARSIYYGSAQPVKEFQVPARI